MELQAHLASSIVEWFRGELTKPTWHWLKFRSKLMGKVDGVEVYEIAFSTNPRFCDVDTKCSLVLAPDQVMFTNYKSGLNVVLEYADPKLFDKLLLLVNNMPSMK